MSSVKYKEMASPYISSMGTIDINIKTGTVLAETVTVIVYATYSSNIIIEEGHVYHTTF